MVTNARLISVIILEVILIPWKNSRHVEHWNVPKMALFKQILRPSRGFGLKDYVTKWLKFVQVNR